MNEPKLPLDPIKSEILFRTLAETIPSAIFVLRGFKIVYTNPAVKKLTGYETIELIDQDFREVIAESYRTIMDPFKRQDGWSKDIPDRLEMKLKRNDGIERWVDASMGRIDLDGESALILTVLDITEREELLTLLEAEQARLQAIIQSAPEGIVITDAQGLVVLLNPAAGEMFGRAHQVYGKTIDQASVQLCHPDGTEYKAEENPLTRSAREGKTITNAELLIIHPDGERFSLLGSTAPIQDRRGMLSGAVGIFQDITQRRQAEDAIRREASRFELLAALSQSFAEAGLYYPAVLSTIAERVAETIGDACLIRLVSDDGLWLDPVAFHHTDPEAFTFFRSVLHATRKRVDEGADGQVFQTGQPLIVLDMTLDELKQLDKTEYTSWLEKYPVQNALYVPLRAQGRLIGALSVIRSHTKRPYSMEDQVFVQDLADRAALAIENARLYASEAQRSRELEALHKAASALLSTLDLENLLGQILDAAQNAIPAAEKGLLYLASPGTGELRVRAMLGYSNPRVEKIDMQSAHSYLTSAVNQRKPLLIHDTRQGLVDTNPTAGAEARSAIVAPLIVENRVLGALSLSASYPSAFSESDLRLLVSLAATTTAAIQNAFLHTEVQRMAITDSLTGQYNRRGFDELGKRELDRFQRFGRPLSVIMLDIDLFKNVNDTHGHAVGDQVLTTLARRCRSHIRHVDVLGRYGGEEFAILLPETDLFTANEIAERIRRSIAAEPIATAQGAIHITVSLGVSKAIAATTSLEKLIDQADAALYKAKQGGRNRVEVG